MWTVLLLFLNSEVLRSASSFCFVSVVSVGSFLAQIQQHVLLETIGRTEGSRIFGTLAFEMRFHGTVEDLWM
jgi:hypothetical protein